MSSSTCGDTPNEALDAGTQVRQLPLRCPQCQAEGRIDWTALGRAIECHRCSCQFVVLKGGRTEALASLPQVAYTCPRCRTTGTVPALLATHGTNCPRCKLPLALGPDRRLYSVDVATRLRRQAGARQAARLAALDSVRSMLTTCDGKWRRGRVALACCAVTVLLAATALAAQAYLDNSPQTFAARLVRLCLAGDAEKAERYLADNPVQQVEFERWHLRHLTSLRDKFRPAGDRVEIDVRALEATDDCVQLEVEMRSPAIGTRRLPMTWQREGDRWTFDAAGTLAASQRPVHNRDSTVSQPRVPRRRTVSPTLVPAGI